MAYDVDLADRVRSILHDRPGFSERRMFGGICFMIGGHMCCGVIKTDLMVRLTPEQLTAALRRPHTRPMDFTRKPIKSMLYVDGDGTATEAGLKKWVEAAVTFARTLPPKN